MTTETILAILHRYEAARRPHVEDWKRLGYHVAHLRPSLAGGMAPAQVTAEWCMAHVRRRTEEGGAVSTACAELKFVHTALKWAGVNPLPRFWFPEVDNYRTVIVAEERLAELLAPHDWLPYRIHVYVNVAVRTGARRGVIERLAWERVNLEPEPRPHPDPARRQRGELLPGLAIDFREPGRRSSRKRATVAGIGAKLLPVLQAARERTPGPLVLGSTTAVYYHVCKLFERLGMPGLTPHTMRHTFATLALIHGESIERVASAMGATPATVRRRYSHPTVDHLRGVYDAF